MVEPKTQAKICLIFFVISIISSVFWIIFYAIKLELLKMVVFGGIDFVFAIGFYILKLKWDTLVLVENVKGNEKQ